MTGPSEPLDLRAEIARIDQALTRRREPVETPPVDPSSARHEDRAIWWAAAIGALVTAVLILADRAIASCGGL